MGFYVLVNCPQCDGELYALCVTLIEHNGRPVVGYDIASGLSLDCEECNAEVFVGDPQILLEPCDA